MMSRSTLGFRALLKEEEIEFEMVSKPSSKIESAVGEETIEGFEDLIATKYILFCTRC